MTKEQYNTLTGYIQEILGNLDFARKEEVSDDAAEYISGAMGDINDLLRQLNTIYEEEGGDLKNRVIEFLDRLESMGKLDDMMLGLDVYKIRELCST